MRGDAAHDSDGEGDIIIRRASSINFLSSISLVCDDQECMLLSLMGVPT